MAQAYRLILGLCILGTLSAHALDSSDEHLDAEWKAITFSPEQAMSVFDLHAANKDKEPVVVDDANCYLAQDRFVACVRAIQGLGEALTPPVTMILKSALAQAQWKSATTLQTVGNWAVIVGSPDSAVLAAMKPQDRVNQVKADRDALLAEGQNDINILKATHQLPVDFKGLATGMLARAPATLLQGKLAVALAEGYFMSLDAHFHMDLTQFDHEEGTDADQKLTGIGVEVSQLGDLIAVNHAIYGGPSMKLVQPGDILLDVEDATNGKHVLKGLPLKDAVSYIRGPTGTTLHITVQRGTDTFGIDIVRAPITVANVENYVVSDMGPKIGYIRLGNFMDEEACTKMKTAIASMETSDNVTGLILDLRNNGGGLVTQAVCIGGIYAGKGPIMYTKDLATGKMKAEISGEDATTHKPLVVMINGGSASASEIVSGALQGLKRAWIVGDVSFGKASMQNGTPMPNDPGLTVFETVARFYVPYIAATGKLAQRTNQRVGVHPDFEVPIKPNATADEMFSMREGDLFPYSLTAETKVWTLLRPTEAAKIQKCLDTGKLSDAIYAGHPTEDYQRLKAQEVLSCQLAKVASK